MKGSPDAYEEVAHWAGIAIGYLRQLENGRRNPSLLLIAALCGALNIQMSDLIEYIVIEGRQTKT
ncbi:helix-turn-helix domain-containing protein [Azospirillum sp. sgz301742]